MTQVIEGQHMKTMQKLPQQPAGSALSDKSEELELYCQESALSCSNQENTNKQNQRPELQEEEALRKRHKYQKKKDRKKKNKLKKLFQQYESESRLKTLLKGIYNGTNTFESIQEEAQNIIVKIRQQEIFFEILNETITNFIQNIFYSIRGILTGSSAQDDIDYFVPEYDSFEECPEFFLLLIDQLDQAYTLIKFASAHVQKLINLYVSVCCPKSNKTQDQHYNLSKNTLNHLINCHSFLRHYVACCQTYYHSQSRKALTKEFASKLAKLLLLIQLKDWDFNDDSAYDMEDGMLHDSQNSTQADNTFSLMAQDNCQINPFESPEKGKKKRRKGNKRKAQGKSIESYKQQSELTEQQIDFAVVQMIRHSQLMPKRLQCDYDKQWLERVAAQSQTISKC